MMNPVTSQGPRNWQDINGKKKTAPVSAFVARFFTNQEVNSSRQILSKDGKTHLETLFENLETQPSKTVKNYYRAILALGNVLWRCQARGTTLLRIDKFTTQKGQQTLFTLKQQANVITLHPVFVNDLLKLVTASELTFYQQHSTEELIPGVPIYKDQPALFRVQLPDNTLLPVIESIFAIAPSETEELNPTVEVSPYDLGWEPTMPTMPLSTFIEEASKTIDRSNKIFALSIGLTFDATLVSLSSFLFCGEVGFVVAMPFIFLLGYLSIAIEAQGRQKKITMIQNILRQQTKKTLQHCLKWATPIEQKVTLKELERLNSQLAADLRTFLVQSTSIPVLNEPNETRETLPKLPPAPSAPAE